MSCDDESAWLAAERRRRRRQILGVLTFALATLLAVGPVWTSAPPKPAAAKTITTATQPVASRPGAPEPAPTDSPAQMLEAPEVLTEPDPRMEPASRPARKLLALKDEIQASMTQTAYEHRTRIELEPRYQPRFELRNNSKT